MASITTKLIDRVFVGLLMSDGAVRLSGTRVSAAVAARPAAAAIREASVSERPTQAPAAAVVKAAPRGAYATANVAGAGNQLFGQQKTQLHTMWALRGLDPWSDPA
ncbi:hypothetical protein [Streptomyces millisiae]|uniref:Uncharacterized protein n=1 Tax=Streptomyces millisiae TaxID=3075542 RepID=A0ABU2LYQ8_9ACTN|nr:hypothetical protein [Streptomyces sp. DSM 44918]MDT0322694.1 hypothetical protein [Streptomyces sp. DSM 44918]